MYPAGCIRILDERESVRGRPEIAQKFSVVLVSSQVEVVGPFVVLPIPPRCPTKVARAASKGETGKRAMLVPPEQGEAKSATVDVPSHPMEQNYEDDVSRVFISLNNNGELPAAPPPVPAAGTAGETEKKQQAEATERGAAARDEKEDERAGALAEYFSSLFDESFCSHNFKLVG